MLTFPVKYLVRKPAVWTRKAKGRFYELLATYWQRAVALHVWAQRCGPADADHGLDGSGTGYHQHFFAGEGAAGIQHHRHRGRDHHLLALFRMFSRNLEKRRAENAKFMEKVWWPISRRMAGKRQQRMDKEHCYFTCPGCGAVCRVPRGKGRIVITCPRCGNEIHGKS